MKKCAAVLMLIFLLLHAAQAVEGEWSDFDYKDAGITSSEFDMVKKHGMSKKELLKLLEYGIMPQEYFSEPWKKLGVSKSEWINAKKQGLEDMDIDRRIYTRSYFNYQPVISFFLPGYYAYKTRRYKYGGTMTGVFVISTVLTFVHKQKTGRNTLEEKKQIILVYPIIALCSMIWSAGDAYISTRYSDNVDANRFSLNIAPSLSSPSVSLSVNF
jgi:hypothetical protein